jgi:hypothetical protein
MKKLKLRILLNFLDHWLPLPPQASSLCEIEEAGPHHPLQHKGWIPLPGPNAFRLGEYLPFRAGFSLLILIYFDLPCPPLPLICPHFDCSTLPPSLSCQQYAHFVYERSQKMEIFSFSPGYDLWHEFFLIMSI